MMSARVRAVPIVLGSVLLLAAAPPPAAPPAASSTAPFPAASVETLSNGVVVASQPSFDSPLVGMQLFLPIGLAQQPADRAGIAGVSAAMVLHTPLQGGAALSDAASQAGAALTFTVDPQDTRYYIEAKASDFPRLFGGLVAALEHPDGSQFSAARANALGAADAALKDPILTAYTMIREVQYRGTGFALPDAGEGLSLTAMAPADALAFVAQGLHGPGTVVALTGDVTPDVLAAVHAAAGTLPPGPVPPSSPPPAPPTRSHEVVAHRDVNAAWIAVGYAAPSQFSADYPAFLVIEALLGRGGDVHAFAYGSDTEAPDDFVGGYYQFEAQPGAFVEFYNGSDVDQDLRSLDEGVGRLRGGLLPDALLDQAKSAARGAYLTSTSTLADQSWLLGRAAVSPAGASFENQLAAQISAVTARDVQRVARAYLTTQTVAVVLPNGAGE